MEIKLEPKDHEIIASMVAEMVYERTLQRPARSYDHDGDHTSLSADIAKTATEKVRELVTEEVKTQIAEVVTKRVTEVLDRGLPLYNSYGQVTETANVETYLRQMFERKESRGYDKPNLTMVEAFIKDHLQGAMNKFMGDELKAAQEQLKQAVDGLMKEKLTSTLKSALGLY